MQITLRIDGKDKVFRQDFISGRMFRRTIEIQKMFHTNEEGKNAIDEAHIDALIGYITELFDKQFTIDQFYDGIQASKLMSTITDCIQSVVAEVSSAVGASDPN